MKIYEIGTGYTPIPAKIAAATESIVEELTRSFIKNGEEAEIIDIAAENRGEIELPITEVKVPKMFTKSDVSLGIMHKLKRVVYSIALSQKLKKILKNAEEKIVLHFHNQYNMFFFLKLVSKKLRKKAVVAYTNHNGVWSLPLEQSEAILKKRYFQEIEAMKNADLVFALNENTVKNLNKYLDIPYKKIVLIGNGVNTEVYVPLDAKDSEIVKKKYGLEDKKVILQVGSIYENKGQERSIRLLCDLLKNNPSVVYAYAGEIVSTEYFEKVKETANKLGVADKVIYLGAVSPGTEMNRLYNLADITVFFSKYEGFSLVCVESLSAGVPVVISSNLSFNLGEGSIVFDEDNGAKIIEKCVFSDQDAFLLIKQKARENVVKNYSWSVIGKKYTEKFIELYKQ